MEVNDALMEKLAELSKLNFSEAEKDALRPGLEEMIAFVNQLSRLDTTGVEPLLHMQAAEPALRTDEAKPGNTIEEVFRNSALHNEAFFKVPKVIKNPE